MSRHAVSRALTIALLALSFLPARSFAGCNVAIVANVAPTDPNGGGTTGQITVTPVAAPIPLQHESTMERVSDVLIYDDASVAGGNCFSQGNHFVLSYNTQLTSPTSIAAASTAYFDVFDSAGTTGLSIAAHSTNAFGANTMVTIIQIDILSQGTQATGAGGLTATPVGSALRVKNLRLDATTLAPGAFATVTVGASAGLPSTLKTVGVSTNTVAPGATVVQQGTGTQSSNSTLTVPEIYDFAENYSGAFRVASTNASGVFGDVATTATKVTFDLGTTIPFGVSVTFPAKMQVGGAAGITLTLTSGGTCNGPVQCTAVYTTTANGPGVFDFTTTTAATPNTGEDGKLPAIGVFIANPSGYGTATMKISLIPSHLASQGDVPTQVLSVALMGTSGVGGGSAGLAISGISPATAVAGTAGASVTVTGSGFTTDSVVQWNGSPRATTYVSSTQLTAGLTAADLAAAGTGSVTVNNTGTQSNAATFTVTTNPTPNSPFKYILPHVIAGNGYASRVTIVNTSAEQNSVVLNFVSQSGATLSSATYDMAPGATVRVSTTDTDRYGSAVTKWATVGSTSPVLANVWYDYIPTQGATAIQNSVGFNDAAPVTDFSLPVEFQPGVSGVSFGKTVGLAIANPNPVAATATVKLVDSTGAVVGTQTWSLPAYGQTAIDLSQAGGFTSVLPGGNFVGSVTVSATSPVSSIAVQDNNGLFSAVPVGQGRAK